jgi:pilus assembly protein FimV
VNLDMRPSPLHLCIRALLGAALLASAAGAAELGDIVTRSYIGQPLAADIELVALTPDEVAGLQVRLAAPDVYRGANVTINPALDSVRMAVVTRDHKQFLHVTTTRAIDADYVHLYVALGAAGRQEVRLATVWLQADPNPAPVVAAVPPASAMTAAQAEQIAAQVRTEREAAAKAAVAAAAPAAAPIRDRARPAPLPSLHESEVGTPGAIRAAAAPAPEPVRRAAPASVRELPERIAGVLVTPRGSPVKPSASKEMPAAEATVPLGVAQALLPLPPLPLPKGVKRPAAPAASCAPAGMSAKECVALDNHNAALSSKLVELEGKLKVLQGAVGGGAATGAAHAAKVPASSPAAAAESSPAAAHASTPATPSHAATLASAAEHAAATPSPAPAAASASAGHAASAGAAKDGSASASASATMETEAHAAKAAAGEGGASATAASASAAASVPAKQVRVLPKLKYKKEKPVEKPTDYTLPLAAGGVGLLALLGAGYIYLRKRRAGGGPLKIWQGFRKKKAPEEAQPLEEVTPESLMQ